MTKSDLPFGSEFSPSQIELPRVLEFAWKHGGNWKAFESTVRTTYFQDHNTIKTPAAKRRLVKASGKTPHLTSLLSSLNSSVPARRSHSKSTISVVTITQPLAFMRSSASTWFWGVREATASATTKQR